MGRKYSRAKHDDQTLRVYDAEHKEESLYVLINDRALATFVKFVLESPLYRRLLGRRRIRRFTFAFASRGARYAWARWNPVTHEALLVMPRGSRDTHTVLHEMAHILAEVHRPFLRKRPRRSSHDRLFLHFALKLYREFEGCHYARRIRREYVRTGALPRSLARVSRRRRGIYTSLSIR